MNLETVLERVIEAGFTVIDFFRDNGDGITAAVTFVAVIYAHIQVTLTRRRNQRAEFANFINRNSQNNRVNETDEYRRNAAEIFAFVNKEYKSNIEIDEYSDYFWGSYSYFSELTSLAYELWTISGKNKRFSGDFSGWHPIALQLSKEVFSEELDNKKPVYYKKAVEEFRMYLLRGRFYAPKFVAFLKKYKEVNAELEENTLSRKLGSMLFLRHSGPNGRGKRRE